MPGDALKVVFTSDTWGVLQDSETPVDHPVWIPEGHELPGAGKMNRVAPRGMVYIAVDATLRLLVPIGTFKEASRRGRSGE